MTVRPIYPGELLRSAQRLVDQHPGAGRPRTIDLRAAIRQSYYAVFHAMTRSAAEMAVEGSVSDVVPPHVLPVTRWLSHSALEELCRCAGGSGNRALRDALAPVDPRLRQVCDSFVALQQQRQLADYDHAFDVDKYVSRTVVDEAARTLATLEVLRLAYEPSYLRFLRLALGANKIAKQR